MLTNANQAHIVVKKVGQRMTGNKIGLWSIVIGGLAVLPACENSGFKSSASNSDRPVQVGGRISKNDVEAPDQFNVEEKGVWDGRPSFGGVWLAHPNVAQPQRVIIRNIENGKSTVGALFRRERNNPGPRIQLSSDAAEKLGALAGQPVRLSVIALKREETEEQVELPIADDASAEDKPQDPQAGEDVAAAAAEAIETVENAPDGEAPAAVEPVPEEDSPSSFGRRRNRAPQAVAPAEDNAGGAEDAAEQAVQPVPETQSPSSFGRRSQRRNRASQASPDVATNAAAGDVTSAPLDATASSAEGAAPASPQAASALQRSYLQAGTFATEANANAAAQKLRAEGLNASVRQQKTENNTLWRVVVGPASAQAEQRQMLEKLKRLGYRDAFPVRG